MFNINDKVMVKDSYEEGIVVEPNYYATGAVQVSFNGALGVLAEEDLVLADNSEEMDMLGLIVDRDGDTIINPALMGEW